MSAKNIFPAAKREETERDPCRETSKKKNGKN
jgi:hypothetical protein